jgi:hypothetical protein
MKTDPPRRPRESARLNWSGKSGQCVWNIALCGLLAGCCLLATSHPALAYESRGARSCVVWQEYRRDQIAGYPLNSETYQTWLIGYLSGIVAGSGMDFLAGTDNESVFLMVDGYCAANPLMNLAAAGTYVARDLMQQKGIVNRGTLP